MCNVLSQSRVTLVTGSELVDWLYQNIKGFYDRREAKKYAAALLKACYIRHTVNKISFSEQCYYVLGDLSDIMSAASITDVDSMSERTPSENHHQQMLQTLPPPQWNNTMYR